MAEKEITKKVTKIIKDVDKIVQAGEQVIKDLLQLKGNASDK